ncbi:hypothetical protein F4776DRAFT_632246 [Hypoxylon sp. NC0597]|nr:hypothetical protein F4776DRAFT_632246 [Hypoxylon sp. NC0597]
MDRLVNLVQFIINPFILAAEICASMETSIFKLLHVSLWTDFRMFPRVGPVVMSLRLLAVFMLASIPFLVKRERRAPENGRFVGGILRPLTNASLTAAYAIMFIRVWLVVAGLNFAYYQTYMGENYIPAWFVMIMAVELGLIPV